MSAGVGLGLRLPAKKLVSAPKKHQLGSSYHANPIKLCDAWILGIYQLHIVRNVPRAEFLDHLGKFGNELYCTEYRTYRQFLEFLGFLYGSTNK